MFGEGRADLKEPSWLSETALVLQRVAKDEEIEFQVNLFVEALARAHCTGGTIYTFGNGGSASEADHLAGELIGSGNREPVRSVALSNMTAALTAVANDKGYALWPAFFVKALSTSDVLFLLSTSCIDHTGRGSNVVEALVEIGKVFPQVRPTVLLITGEKFLQSAAFGIEFVQSIVIPHENVGVVQEVTLALIHEIVRRVEARISSGEA